MAKQKNPHSEVVRRTNEDISKIIASFQNGPKFMQSEEDPRTTARHAAIASAPASVQQLLAQGYTQEFVHRLAKLIEAAGQAPPPPQSPDAVDRNAYYNLPVGVDVQEFGEHVPFDSGRRGSPRPYYFNDKGSRDLLQRYLPFQGKDGNWYQFEPGPDDGWLPLDPRRGTQEG